MPKYYVVWKGKVPGVYRTWDECKKQVIGFPMAKYKSFRTLPIATAAFASRGQILLPADLGEDEIALTVDAACDRPGGNGEYRGVLIPSKKLVFHFGPCCGCTNNVMEFLGIVRGLQWIFQKGLRIPVYSDSKVAMGWVDTEQCNTTMMPQVGTLLWTEIDKSVRWIKENQECKVLVRKWDTSLLGEIPADFNRK